MKGDEVVVIQVVGNYKYFKMRLLMISLLTSVLLLMGCFENINYDFLKVCKVENDIRLLYMDEKGFSKVDTLIVEDTLFLDIEVAYGELGTHIISIPDNVKYIQYGDSLKEISELKECSQPRSGDEALEYFNNPNK